jgi:hypothetical protein
MSPRGSSWWWVGGLSLLLPSCLDPLTEDPGVSSDLGQVSPLPGNSVPAEVSPIGPTSASASSSGPPAGSTQDPGRSGDSSSTMSVPPAAVSPVNESESDDTDGLASTSEPETTEPSGGAVNGSSDAPSTEPSNGEQPEDAGAFDAGPDADAGLSEGCDESN